MLWRPAVGGFCRQWRGASPGRQEEEMGCCEGLLRTARVLWWLLALGRAPFLVLWPAPPGPGVSSECAGRRVCGRAPLRGSALPPACLHTQLRPWLLGSAGGAAPASLGQPSRVGLPGSHRPWGTRAASSVCGLRNLPWSFPRAKADRMEELPVGSRGCQGPEPPPRPHRCSRAQEDSAGCWPGPGSLLLLLALLSDA